MGCTCGTKRTDVSLSHLLFGETLGRGAFGEVISVRKRGSQEKLAMKIIHLENEDGQLKYDRLARIQKEAELLSRVTDHPNCLKIIGFIHENLRGYLIMELCALTLLRALETKPSVVHKNIVPISKQLLSAISHCHGQRVVHRDVKLENVMFGGPTGNTLKLCDFDLARVLQEGCLHGVVGTTPYMAPEIVARQPYNELVDVWSAGVVAYIISFGRFPYSPEKRSDEAMKIAIRTGSPSPFFPPDERGSFLRKLMDRSGEKRCGASEALQLKFLDSTSIMSDFQGLHCQTSRVTTFQL
eukprot:TRINITY_DN19536_c0_g2_i4.p1 TRINITY_DN19536_c0_g2~~TRINITY_DN19536_c0_g2_i4.p1  ORF type:complete len:298 (-),score=39.35 TRINITY_DN19536_c0_g2_i4:296-1189(-)